MTPQEAGLVAQLRATEKIQDPSRREAARAYLGDLLVLESRRAELGADEFHRRQAALVAELVRLDNLEVEEGSDL